MGETFARPGFTIIQDNLPVASMAETLLDSVTASATVDLDCSVTGDLILTHKISGAVTGGYVALWQLFEINIESVSKNLNLVTIVTITPHGFLTGETITIEGVTPASYNGDFVVTVIDDFTFTYSLV